MSDRLGDRLRDAQGALVRSAGVCDGLRRRVGELFAALDELFLATRGVGLDSGLVARVEALLCPPTDWFSRQDAFLDFVDVALDLEPEDPDWEGFVRARCLLEDYLDLWVAERERRSVIARRAAERRREVKAEAVAGGEGVACA